MLYSLKNVTKTLYKEFKKKDYKNNNVDMDYRTKKVTNELLDCICKSIANNL
jgi:hypothetical protein